MQRQNYRDLDYYFDRSVHGAADRCDLFSLMQHEQLRRSGFRSHSMIDTSHWDLDARFDDIC